MDEPTPKCPLCGSKKVVTSGANLKAWYCGDCHREFEAIDDGDIPYGRPDEIAERRERDRTQRNWRKGYGKGKQR